MKNRKAKVEEKAHDSDHEEEDEIAEESR